MPTASWRARAATDSGALDLGRPRALDGLLNLAGALWLRHFRVFVLTAFAVVALVDIAVYGLGQGLLRPGADDDDAFAWGIVGGLALSLVTTPIVTAIHVRVVESLAAGRRLAPGAAITAGLDVFPRVLAVVVVSTIGIALGLVALILPGLYLLVRWFVAPQASVAEDPGGPFTTLRRSADLTRGRFWRTAGIVVLIVFLGGVVSAVLALPFDLLADGLDADALVLVGLVLGETVAISFTALVATLVYFDLRARHAQTPAAPPRAPAERGF